MVSHIGELGGYLKGNYTIAGFDPTGIKALLHLICTHAMDMEDKDNVP